MQQVSGRRLPEYMVAALAILSVATGAATATAQSPAADLPGVLIVAVTPDGPAERAGLARGDIILAVDGESIDGLPQLVDVLRERRGNRVDVRYRHGDEVRTARVELGTGDDEQPMLGVVPEGRDLLFSLRRGLSPAFPERFRHFGDGDGDGDGDDTDEEPHRRRFERRHEFRFPDDLGRDFDLELRGVGGALILSVAADSPAEQAGLQHMDVITAIDGAAIDSPEALATLVAARAPGDRLQITLVRGEQEQTVTVTACAHAGEDGTEAAFLGVRYAPMPAGLHLPELQRNPEAERDQRRGDGVERFRIRPRLRIIEPFTAI